MNLVENTVPYKAHIDSVNILFKSLCMKNLKFLLSLIVVNFVCSCNDDTTDIKMSLENNFETIYDSIESVELLPLETNAMHLIGANPQLEISEDTYIIYDIENSSIGRYSNSGQFLNKIGNKGNGPGEYTNILNIQVMEDKLIVYSAPNFVHYYYLNGDHINTIKLEKQGRQSYSVSDGVITYYGYSSGESSRLSMLKEQEQVSYLPNDAKILAYMSDSPIFSALNNEVYILDSYSPTIYKYCNNTLSPYIKIDLGDYEVPREYYLFDDSFKAAEYLFERDFAIIKQYRESRFMSFIEIHIQHKDGTVLTNYGIGPKDSIKWFTTTNDNNSFLSGTFKCLDEECIYCLVDPAKLTDLKHTLPFVISNQDILDNINVDDNYVIAKVSFK